MIKIEEKEQKVREREEDWEEYCESESKILKLLSEKT